MYNEDDKEKTFFDILGKRNNGRKAITAGCRANKMQYYNCIYLL